MKSERKKTILLVDNRAISATAKAKTLKKKGFNVVIAHNGEDAVKIAGDNTALNLIIMGIDLGKGMDGTKAAQIILKNREMPIVFLLNHTKKEIAAKTRKMISYGYVDKNSSGTVLLASIKTALKLFKTQTKFKNSEQKLRKSEQRLRYALEGSLDGIWDWNLKTGEVYFSPRYYTMLGYEPNEFLPSYERWRELLHPDDVEKSEKSIMEAIEKLSSFKVEFRLRRKDGSYCWILGRGKVAETDNNGQASRVSGSHADINERKLAEKALRTSENKIGSIFRAAPIGIGVTSKRVLIELNEYIYKLLGYSPEELIGKSARIFYPTQEEFEFVGKEKYKQIEQFGSGSVETKWKCKDGRIIDILLSSTPLNLKEISGGVTFTALDITGRKKSEEALKKSQERFTLAQRSANIGSWEWNILTGEINWSETIEPMFGFKKGEFEATYDAYLKCIHPDDVDYMVERVNEAIYKNEEYKNLEFRIIWSNGSVRWVLANGTVYRDIDEKPYRMIGIIQDITEKKKIEQSIVESERKLAESLKVAKVGYWEYYVQSDSFIFNDQYYSLHNTTAEKAGGYRMSANHFAENFVYPEDRYLVANAIASAVNSPDKNYEFQTEARILTIDKKPLWVTVWFKRQIDERDNTIKLIGVNQDINSRKLAEEKLKQSEENYRRFFEEDLSGVFLSTPGGQIKECNQAYVQMMEYDNVQELLNSNPVSHYTESLKRTEFLNLLRKEKKLTNYEGGLVTKKGKHIRTLENINGVFDEENNLIEFWGYVNDITDIKNAEQILKNAAAEKEALHRELLHRVKNSFNQIRSLVYLEREKIKDPVANNILEDIEMRIGTLSHLYSLLNESGISQQIDLGDYLNQIANSLIQSYIEDKEKIIVKTIFDKINISPKTASSVGLIVNEILTNSFKYAFPDNKKGTISINIKAINGNAEIEIADNGIGLPNNFNIEESTGMGLQLVNMLIQQIDGKLNVEGKKGTKFNFVFPIDE